MTDHGPDCIACTDPALAAAHITARRAKLDDEAAAVREIRESVDELRAKYPPSADLAPDDAQAVQDVIRMRCGIANAAQLTVNQTRAHLDRVEAAHPQLREMP